MGEAKAEASWKCNPASLSTASLQLLLNQGMGNLSGAG